MKKKIFLILFLLLIIPTLCFGQRFSFGVGTSNLDKSPKYSTLSLKFEFPEEGVYPYMEALRFNSKEFYISIGLSYTRSFWKVGLATGHFEQKYEGLNLGGEIEFHSFIEVMFTVNNVKDIGINLSHISNAGLSRTNPGTNLLRFIFYF